MALYAAATLDSIPHVISSNGFVQVMKCSSSSSSESEDEEEKQEEESKGLFREYENEL